MKSLKKITLVCSGYYYRYYTRELFHRKELHQIKVKIEPVILYSGQFINKIIFFKDWIEMIKINIEPSARSKFDFRNKDKKINIALSSSDNCIYVNKVKFNTCKNKIKIPIPYGESVDYITIRIYMENYSKKIKTLLLCLKKLKIKIPKEIIFVIIDFVMNPQ